MNYLLREFDVCLIGSAARGEFDQYSDVDLLCVGSRVAASDVMEIIAATENPLFQHITSANLDYAVCNVAQLQCWYENGSKKAWEIFRSGRWLRFREPQQCNLSIKPAPYPFIAEYQRLSALERGTRLARGYSLSASVAEGRLL